MPSTPKAQALAEMTTLAPIANLCVCADLPGDIKMEIAATIAKAKERLGQLASEHLGYTYGDHVTTAIHRAPLLVDGFFIPHRSSTLFVRVYPIKQDGAPRSRQDSFSVYLDAKVANVPRATIRTEANNHQPKSVAFQHRDESVAREMAPAYKAFGVKPPGE